MEFLNHDSAAAVDLIEIMEQLKAAIADLKGLVASTDLQAARVFELPKVVAGNEIGPQRPIPVNPQEGETARRLALDAFDRFEAEGDESKREVYRLPGVICLSVTDPGQIIEAVGTVNELKSRFALRVLGIPERYARWQTVHKPFPRLLTLQVTRQIQLYNEPLLSVNFTWGRKSSLVKIDKGDVIEMLELLRDQRPPRMQEDVWDQMIDTDIAHVQSLAGSTQLRYRRDLKARPLCNLRNMSRKKMLREGNLPILVVGNPETPRIGLLRDFDPDEEERAGRRPGENRKTEPDRLLHFLPVYLLQSGQEHL